MKKNIYVPSSKSEGQRAIILGGIFGANISNISLNDDIKAAYNVAEALGANIVDNGKISKSSKITEKAYVAQSATSLRMAIPIMLALLGECEISMDNSLASRPLSTYFELMDKISIKYKLVSNKNISTLYLKGKLLKGDYDLNKTNSSQFVSGLIMALACLEGTSRVKAITGSEQYIDVTIDVLEKFGILVEKQKNEYIVYGGTGKAANINISGDWSSAAPFIAAKALGYDLDIHGLNLETKQPDKKIVEYLRLLGCEVNGLQIKSQRPFKPIQINGDSCPDIIPLIALLCTQAKGISKIENLSRLRYKECDRLTCTVEMLKAMGANIYIEKLNNTENIIIDGDSNLKGGIYVNCCNDHRMIMLAAIANLLCCEPLIINDKEKVAKSYPDFWESYYHAFGRK